MEGPVPSRPAEPAPTSLAGMEPGPPKNKTQPHNPHNSTRQWKVEFHLDQRSQHQHRWPGWNPALQKTKPNPTAHNPHNSTRQWKVEFHLDQRSQHQPCWPGWNPALQKTKPNPTAHNPLQWKVEFHLDQRPVQQAQESVQAQQTTQRRQFLSQHGNRANQRTTIRIAHFVISNKTAFYVALFHIVMRQGRFH